MQLHLNWLTIVRSVAGYVLHKGSRLHGISAAKKMEYGIYVYTSVYNILFVKYNGEGLIEWIGNIINRKKEGQKYRFIKNY